MSNCRTSADAYSKLQKFISHNFSNELLVQDRFLNDDGNDDDPGRDELNLFRPF